MKPITKENKKILLDLIDADINNLESIIKDKTDNIVVLNPWTQRKGTVRVFKSFIAILKKQKSAIKTGKYSIGFDEWFESYGIWYSRIVKTALVGCSTCNGYGLWPIGTPLPLGRIDGGEWGQSAKKCPECGTETIYWEGCPDPKNKE